MECRRVADMTGWGDAVIILTFLILHLAIRTDCLNVMDPCNNSTECPPHSECSPRGCEGNACLCVTGFVPAVDHTTCYKGALLDRECDGENVRCSESLALCLNGKCQCRPAHIPASDNLRCKSKPSFGIYFALLGEFCDGSTVICQRSGQFCDQIRSECVCKEGWRPATLEELRAEPFRNQECRPVDFSLNLPPEQLNCTKPVLPVPANIGEKCVSYNNCPDFSDCVPRGCDGKLCVCIEGYYPANSGMECKPVASLNESCGMDSVCFGENHTTNCVDGVCECASGFVQTSDDRCKPMPEPKLEYALFGEVCGHFGDKRILCHDEWTTCDSVMDGRCVCQHGTRPATDEERAREWTGSSPCRLKDYGLDVPAPEECELRKALEACQNWTGEEIFWREFFRRQQANGRIDPFTKESEWLVVWNRHRDKLRECSKLMPPTEGDNWSEEVREVRIS